MIHCYQKCQQNQFLHESWIISHLHPFPIPNVVWLCKFSTLLWVFFKCSKDMFFEHPTDLVVFAHVGSMWKRISMHNLKRQSVDFSCLLWGRKDKAYDKEQTGSKYTKSTENRKRGRSRAFSPNQIKKDYLNFEIGDQIQLFTFQELATPVQGWEKKKVPEWSIGEKHGPNQKLIRLSRAEMHR